MDANGKLDKLREITRSLESVVVAFSGGVDSTLVTRVAADVLPGRAIAATASSETYPRREVEEARQLASQIGIPHVVFETSELAVEHFRSNPPQRCYYCKKELYAKLMAIARERGFKHVADGANSDDVGDFRPGLRAAAEMGIRSPLREAGLGKEDVRALSRMLGLPNWARPALACLASRFPYGEEISEGKLAMVEKAEEFLRGLGVSQVRVRHHGNLARIEAPPDEIASLATPENRGKIAEAFKKLGYVYVALDLDGYRTGSMNEALRPAETVNPVRL